MSSNILAPFQLLELNIISAQDLSPVSRSMRAYAVAWVHPDRKLSTRVDAHGRNNPTWNDKFVFRVDEAFLRNDTSAVMIEIFALHWFRDIHVGTVRVLVGNLIRPPQRSHRHSNHMQLGMRFVALQVRRPSGRPQGILNIGVALLDSSMRSMPLYTQLSSAVGYRHLMGEEDPFQNNPNASTTSNNQNSFSFLLGKPELRRTKSDSSSMLGSELLKKSRVRIAKGGSTVSSIEPFKKNIQGSTVKGEYGSVASGSDVIPIKDKFGKGNPLGSGLEVEDPLKRVKLKPVKPAGSVISGSDSSDPTKKFTDSPTKPKKHPGSPYKPLPPRIVGNEFGAPNKFKTFKGAAMLTESELGPSPSEVAAAKAKEKLLQKTNDEDSSGLPGWEMDSSVEGLQSKLERWRAELPPLYDSSFPSSTTGVGGGKSTGRHSRRHADGGNSPGLFSCFSKICGCECSIVCGPGPPKKTKKKGSSGRLIRSPSNNNTSSL
ncbi:uncharacterized protein LOC116118519 [Pistacia vera]|uniref:uncharacterized protein LOC116118519 n=1 Tax=Pistacia vera TaxID=55513 RepID=UPI001262FC47|nr:uncharacterized protein LOC116118519 [Pistacia vera]